MKALFKREFRSLFSGARGYAASAVLLLATGFLVIYYGFLAEVPSITYILFDLMLVSGLTCTLLCLGIFSESDALLRTLPLSSLDVTLSKYLAVLSVYAVQVAMLAFVPFIYNYFGEVDFAASYLSLLAYFLFLASVAAVDLFLACRIKKRVLAIVFSISYIALMYLLEILDLAFSRSGAFGEILGEIFFFVGIFNRFEPFVYGNFCLSTVIYYISIALFFFILTLRLVDKGREEERA